jgi:hypothetical protein
VALGVVGAVVLLAVAGFLARSGLGGGAPEAHHAVQVSASQQWTDTGVDLRQGQRVRVVASGQISSAPGVRNDPDGTGDPHNPLSLLPVAGHAALIAKIGDGAPTLIGREASATAAQGGRLYLGVNDLAFRDNSGYFQAEVVVGG